jgi:hypothetical protein
MSRPVGAKAAFSSLLFTIAIDSVTPRLPFLTVATRLVAGLYYFSLMRRPPWPLDHYPLLNRTRLEKRYV